MSVCERAAQRKYAYILKLERTCT